ncbi:hypothetical protein K432DRAFT_314562, partial [Lepidopterella palustris CBS 459.81]
QVHLCTETNWQYCTESITSPLNCVVADNMDNINSIAIDLNLCCRFYADDQCSVSYMGAPSLLYNEQWFPGSPQVSDLLKNCIGSYQCLDSNTTCPPLGAIKYFAPIASSCPPLSPSPSPTP